MSISLLLLVSIIFYSFSIYFVKNTFYFPFENSENIENIEKKKMYGKLKFVLKLVSLDFLATFLILHVNEKLNHGDMWGYLLLIFGIANFILYKVRKGQLENLKE